MADAFSPRALLAILKSRLGSARRLWVAYSGGLDSTVLLHATAEVRGALDCAVHAVHLEHGLHPDSAAWADHCRATCTALDVPLTERSLAIQRAAGESLEAVAREARQRAFAGLLTPGDVLVTGQHRDDQAETLLLALLRGSGPAGLAAMPVMADLGGGRLLRPLLGFSRAELAAYARRTGLRWIDDPSNADTAFDRNFLRLRVLPLLRGRWPSLDLTLARSAAHCAEAATLLDAAADDWLAGQGGPRPGTLSVTGLRALDPPRCRAVLRRWLARGGFRPPSSVVLERVLSEVLPAAPDRSPLVAWPGCEIRRHRDALFALAPLPPPPSPRLQLRWDGTAPLPLPAGLGELVLPGPAASAAPIPGMRVVFRWPGLRCRAAAGPSRSLKQLYQQADMPAWLRPYVPLMLIDGRLAAVAGVAQCEGRLGGLQWRGHPWHRLGLPVADGPRRRAGR